MKLKLNAWKLEFGFGVGLDSKGKKLSETVRAAGIEAIRTLATKLYGGCTVVKTAGDWLDPITGLLHSEEGRTVIVYVELPFVQERYTANRKRMVAEIRKQLRQAAVAVCRSEVRFTIEK